MTTLNATQARANLYSLMDQAEANHEPIQITGKRTNAVLIAESDWKAIEETLHLNSIPGMAESLIKEAQTPRADYTKLADLEW